MRGYVITLLIFMASVLVTACHLEVSPSGDLYGYWHLVTVDTLQGTSADFSREKVFWGVENRLVQIFDRSGAYPTLVMNFERSGDSLFLQKPFLDDRNNGDPEVSDPEVLSFYGLGRESSHFKVEHLTNDKMILSNNRFHYHFRKQ